jgi:predicted Zn finger-like uncharacterized protein
MLFTRCPDCETTFRVTDEALKKASGQVRCGRCASVFNAYAELQDSAKVSDSQSAPPLDESPPERAEPAQRAPAPASTATLETVAPVEVRADTDKVASLAAPPAAPAAPLAAPPAAHEANEAGDDLDLITANEIDEVLTTSIAEGPAPGGPAWQTFAADPARDRPSRWWGAAAALALLGLFLQGVNHYRSEIAGHPTFGPWIQQAYGLFGTELTPSWDVHQYEILDWVATAEPNSRGLGSLKITARIQNRGPLRQPFPAVQLRLKDRWEAAVSSRVFTPAEYLPSESPRGRLMSPGETARAEIEVVDPGPDAYGFELDVCIEVEASLVTCGTDEVFL